MTKLGYARISTRDQTVEQQTEILTKAGCERVWVETASGYRADRPELAALLDYAREGDTIVIWRLDRLGRSVKHLLATATDLHDRGIELVSLTEAIDTTSAMGKMVFTVLAALAEFEGNLRRERQELAWANGAQRGRPKVMSVAQTELARRLRAEGQSLAEIGRGLGIPKTTLHRTLATASAGASTA